MREIKFRAWDKESKKMATWEELQVALDSNISWSEISNLMILMQFTGLKDKNGKEIYEGDIFQEGYYDKVKPILYIVEWREKDASFGWKQIVPVLTENFKIKDTKIIGNIYENQELLKEKK